MGIFGIDLNHCKIGLVTEIAGPTTGLTTATPKTTITFVINGVFVPGKNFQPSIMFVGEARSLRFIGAP